MWFGWVWNSYRCWVDSRPKIYELSVYHHALVATLVYALLVCIVYHQHLSMHLLQHQFESDFIFKWHSTIEISGIFGVVSINHLRCTTLNILVYAFVISFLTTNGINHICIQFLWVSLQTNRP